MFTLLYKVYFLKFRSNLIDNWHTRIIVRVFNHLLPYYFKLTRLFSKNKLSLNTKSNSENYIVSLTTFPARIDNVWLTIETLLRQEVKPDKILLWLYEGEFNGKESLPKNLLQQEKRGLEIRFVNENLMPHKKYFYTMKEFSKANIITIDDDFFYPLDLIDKLIKRHESNPKEILCILTREIKTKDSFVLPYNEWNYVEKSTIPSFKYLTMGGGGTLFPEKSLHPMLFDKEKLLSMALKADDLWLKTMSLKNNTKVIGLGGEYSRFFVPIIKKNDTRLMDSNIGESQNDIIFKELLAYFNIPLSIFNS